MDVFVVIRVVAVAAVVWAATASAHSQEANTRRSSGAEALIDAFDECIQDRFTDLTINRFGVVRVTPASPHAFFANNLREESIVQYLEVARLNVVMYVGGRKLLAEKGYSITPQRGALVLVPGRNGAQLDGPILVTPLGYHAPPRDAPPAATLIDDATRTLRTFGQSNATSFSAGGWEFAARPVRASSQACLGCHRRVSSGASTNALQIGDALGVVLYGYQKRPPAQNP
jgi:hypothetical protein